MTDDHLTPAISALVDGEPVDPDQLAAALEDPEGRAALIDFVRMRAAMRAGEPPLPGSLASLRPTGKRPFDSLRSLRAGPFDSLRSLRAGWPAVAAVLVLVFLAGLFAPRPWTTNVDERADAPPAPTRVERFTPGVDWHPSN